tara:strand:+ start:581 stop:1618 length:1038 start_codon:yes stop_codon:yes gene_type:complete
MGFFDNVLKDIDEDQVRLAKDLDDSEFFIDTGSYIFNALCSKSIFGGVSANKVTAIAGETSTGKTFFALAVVQNFLKNNPDGGVIYFDSESAITKELLQSRGIDPEGKRFYHATVDTIEDFRHVSYKILDNYLSEPEDKRKPMLMVLDSLGMLSTRKETEDVSKDKQVRDMTKAQLIKGAFRILTGKLGKAKVPLIVTNHTYDVVGAYMPTKEMGGGSGLKYAASTIIHLRKSKEKDKDHNVVGNIIKAKTAKSRLSKENKEVAIRLYYDERGLDKYYGLLELAENELWPKVSTRYEVNGKKIYGSEILKNPEKYFTEEVLQKLDAIAKRIFSYGSGESTTNDTE